MKVVLISDTHGLHEASVIPEGDILIHAGDISRSGKISDIVRFNDFLKSLPHTYKIVIAGNHDLCLEREDGHTFLKGDGITYLQDESIMINGLKFYGSPWQPWFDNWAFNVNRGQAIRQKWNLIPKDTDVLITHGPPFGYGDLVNKYLHVGCEDLLDVIKKVKPKYHVYGHIHEDCGQWKDTHTTYINASSCNLKYRLVNAPIVINMYL